VRPPMVTVLTGTRKVGGRVLAPDRRTVGRFSRALERQRQTATTGVPIDQAMNGSGANSVWVRVSPGARTSHYAEFSGNSPFRDLGSSCRRAIGAARQQASALPAAPSPHSAQRHPRSSGKTAMTVTLARARSPSGTRTSPAGMGRRRPSGPDLIQIQEQRISLEHDCFR
jgi:hypothetical protein